MQVPSNLIYRATRDGFRFDDWKRCVMGKGPTMTLIKVSRLQARRIQFGSARCWVPLDGGLISSPPVLILFSFVPLSGEGERIRVRRLYALLVAELRVQSKAAGSQRPVVPLLADQRDWPCCPLLIAQQI